MWEWVAAAKGIVVQVRKTLKPNFYQDYSSIRTKPPAASAQLSF